MIVNKDLQTDIIDVICSNNIKLLHKAKDSLENGPDNLLESDDSLEELPAFTLKEEPQNDSPAQKYLAFILKY
ncbi:hypothetical protein HPULCUR_002594 [Helicostylum pulchrum]|uniref:Uncharacterized protein n=1 Tax=Helicostylum pulchrum TaxID=562976 RepID=A0ABP9XQY2_9FUNG